MSKQALASLGGKPKGTGRSGGALGRKGLETRARLLQAAERLLHGQSAVSLTATAIAQEAQTSLATLYVYFGDVRDILLVLAEEASDAIGEILAALEAWDPQVSSTDGARAFLNAYRAYWTRHHAVLVLRNMESDRGDVRFSEIRKQAGVRIVSRLASNILDGRAHADLTEEQAMARAIVIFSAIERLATRETLYEGESPAIQSALYEAQIGILTELVSG